MLSKKLLIIDNYPEGLPKKRKNGFMDILDPLKPTISYEIISYSLINQDNYIQKTDNFDGIILTGSPAFLSEQSTEKKWSTIIKLIQDFSKPLLGICFGHQLIGKAFGFEVGDLEIQSEYEKIIKIKINQNFDLLHLDCPSEISVEVVHRQEIKYNPHFDEIFNIFASTQVCKIHILKHKQRPIYGVQFHPESQLNSEIIRDGRNILLGFIHRL